MTRRSAVRRLYWSGSIFFAVMALLASACTRTPTKLETLPAPVSSQQSTPPGASGDWYSVYFTDPHSPGAKSYQGGPDERLAEAISSARQGVDVAVYDINLPGVASALVLAKKNGARVRLVTESDNMDEPQVQDIRSAGIPVLSDQREGSMHDSFAVIDNQEVWTGSMNFTTGDAYLNNNDLLCIRSPQLAQDYTAEFEQMASKGRFGSDKVDPPPYPSVQIGDSLVEVYFSPAGATAAHLEALVRSARQSIYFLAFSFESGGLADAIIEQASSGLKTAGVMEETQVQPGGGGVYGRFQQAAIDVRLDGNLRNMHHQTLIIDGQIVVTGSDVFNSGAGEENDENTLVIHNPQVAGLYQAEFDRIYAEAIK